MLPQEITAFGAVRVPAEASQPPLTIEPNVTVQPEIAVNVQTGADDTYDAAMKQQSALGGSGSITGGGKG